MRTAERSPAYLWDEPKLLRVGAQINLFRSAAGIVLTRANPPIAAAWCVYARLGITTTSDHLAGKDMRRLR